MKFYARRIGFYAFTLWAAISINFLLPRLMPGNPADIMIAKMQRAGGEVSETTIRNIKLLLGGDDSSLWGSIWPTGDACSRATSASRSPSSPPR